MHLAPEPQTPPSVSMMIGRIVGLLLLSSFSVAPRVSAHVPTEAVPDQDDQENGERQPPEEQRPSYRLIPFPILVADPTNGTGLGGGLLALYRLNERSPRDSKTDIFVYVTNTRSWRLGIDQMLSFREDLFRSTTTARFGNVNNRFDYRSLPSDVVYGEPMTLVTSNLTYNVVGRLYAGASYRYSRTDYVFDEGTEEEREFSERVLGRAGAAEAASSGFGLIVGLDSRDHEYTPTTGIHTDVQLHLFRRWSGSDDDYTTIESFFNHYRSIGTSQVLAIRFRWRDAYADVPFNGQSTFGGVDLRGYATGKYRGNGMVAGQAEYRFPVWKRVGGAIFGGLGRVYGASNTLGADETLPSAGAGIRFLLLKNRGANIGLDVAIGRDGNHGLYFHFGEAF